MSYTLPGGVRTSVSFSESRSEVGITRSVVGEREQEGVVQRDTSIAAEISQSRNTSVSSNIDFDIGRFKLRSNASFGQNRRTNTAKVLNRIQAIDILARIERVRVGTGSRRYPAR